MAWFIHRAKEEAGGMQFVAIAGHDQIASSGGVAMRMPGHTFGYYRGPNAMSEEKIGCHTLPVMAEGRPTAPGSRFSVPGSQATRDRRPGDDDTSMTGGSCKPACRRIGAPMKKPGVRPGFP